jgi:hypothetical protein
MSASDERLPRCSASASRHIDRATSFAAECHDGLSDSNEVGQWDVGTGRRAGFAFAHVTGRGTLGRVRRGRGLELRSTFQSPFRRPGVPLSQFDRVNLSGSSRVVRDVPVRQYVLSLPFELR